MKKMNYDDFVAYLKKKNFQKRIDSLVKKYSGKKVLLYGTGTLFDAITKNYDLSGLNIIAVSDLKFSDEEIKEYGGFKAVTVDELVEEKPDIILICLFYEFVANEFLESYVFLRSEKIQYEPILKKSFFEKLFEFNV